MHIERAKIFYVRKKKGKSISLISNTKMFNFDNITKEDKKA